MKSEDKNGTRLWGAVTTVRPMCGSSTTTAINQANFLKTPSC